MFGRQKKKDDVDTTKFYNVLEVDKNASDAIIKKAFRKQAMKHHPDRGGDVEKFKELQQAYECLSDPQKRKVYDEHGEEGLEGFGGRHTDMSDLFAEMFGQNGGGFPGFGGMPRQKRGQNITHKLSVDLEGFYLGKTIKLNLTKKVTCLECDGSGSQNAEAVVKCAECSGSGVKVSMRQLGPGMVTQMQGVCPNCDGSGDTVDEKFACEQCAGKKITSVTKLLEVQVERGMKVGERIVFHGEGDEAAGVEAGDVIFSLEAKPHAVFTRKGPNLEMKKEINLLQALTGFSFVVTHLDGRKLLVKSDSGAVVKPGDTKVVMNEGMPIRGRDDRGTLIIHFEVVFPEPGALSDLEQVALEKVLPNPSPLEEYNEEEVDECQLEELDPSNLPREEESFSDQGFGEDVGCQQQ